MQGNRRLTTLTAIVLLVLLFVEGLTVLLGVREQLRLHVFVGMLLIPPIALKLLSVGFRFVRYYTGSRPYRAAGPPHWLMRSLGPLVVASTVALFASGVALIAFGNDGRVLAVHRVSFFAWFALMSIHVLWHARELPRTLFEEWSERRANAGPLLRATAIATTLVVGLAVALLTVHLASGYSHHRFDGGFGDGR